MRVGVIGAGGRMGTLACQAIVAAPDLELVAAVGRSHAGVALRELAEIDTDVVVSDDLAALTAAGAGIGVELTGPHSVGPHLRWLLEHDVHAVVGATGLSDDDLDAARAVAVAGVANAVVAPNFAIGAVLLMRFAAEAAAHLSSAEIVELHHDRKADAPSGTALRTAELIADAWSSQPDVPLGDDRHPGARGADHHGVRVHSVRLPGLVAHQEVLFGATGQTLSLRHDTVDRTAFMPGMLLACRRVRGVDGVVVGLEHLL